MRYKKHIKQEALQLCLKIGTKNASQELGIPVKTLLRWKKEHKIGKKSHAELEMENFSLKQENEILKHALGLFAKDRLEHKETPITTGEGNEGKKE